ncbi:MAG: alpha-mannosidase [Oscillospiraceae bacterium]
MRAYGDITAANARERAMRQDRLKKYLWLKEQTAGSTFADRIIAQLGFLLEVSLAQDYRYDNTILPQIDRLYDAVRRDGGLTVQSTKQVENDLLLLSSVAKKYEVTCVAHAHIDMNWMWGFQETAALTVDTFRTMLDLMEDYPEFTFSQSQASVYRIVEEYCPSMLEEIRARVKEGRWEVAASTWVENDKNMSGEEAMARHILYTKRYLSNLLDIAPDSIQLDFEPDTFGHSQNLPELLNRGGIKYYYHCRGNDAQEVYTWRAPSGAELLAYREPMWYNSDIDSSMFSWIPGFCARNKVSRALKVYGVGDHGGGPTRRDIDAIREMSTWPLFPTLKFGTLHGFFEELEQERENLPSIAGELGYIFTGCYTSQSRIKQANHLGEARIGEAEALDAMARHFADDGYTTASPFEASWRKILFNQFHDILPGSGTIETREYAMGQFQKAMAGIDINGSQAMKALAAHINTSEIVVVPDSGTAVGAGVGYGLRQESHYRMPFAERGGGLPRIFHLFNATQFPRRETVELTVWDLTGEDETIFVTDTSGKELPSQLMESGQHYWGHNYRKLLVLTDLPAMGYSTVLVNRREPRHIAPQTGGDARRDYILDENILLENDKLRILFSARTMKLLSLKNKTTGREMVNSREYPAGAFRLVTENPKEGMTSWRVGRQASVLDLNESCPVNIQEVHTGSLQSRIRFEIPFLSSKLTATVSLSENSDLLEYDVSVDWREVGSPEAGIPQLNFHLPFHFYCTEYRCGIQLGFADRPAREQDVPCVDLICPIPLSSDETVVLLSDSHYGYRGADNSISVDLIRGSYDPDPYPEYGLHNFRLGIAVATIDKVALKALASRFVHPVSACPGTVHSGTLPLTDSLFQTEGSAVVSAVKEAEDGSGLIVRVYNPTQETDIIRLRFKKPVQSVYSTDLNERSLEALPHTKGNTVEFDLHHNALRTVKVVFAPF